MPHLHDPGVVQPIDSDRRDFLVAGCCVATAIGAIASGSPFLKSLAPAEDTLAMAGPLDVDVSVLKPGQQIVLQWQGKPIFVVRRTAEMVEALGAPEHLDRLRDPDSLAHQQPDYVRNGHRSLNPDYLVVVGICTHLGCVPGFRPKAGEGPVGKWSGGYRCACHGSLYDLAGRVFKNVPAPYNLPVPPHCFLDAKTLRIGENPQGSEFSLGSIEQL